VRCQTGGRLVGAKLPESNAVKARDVIHVHHPESLGGNPRLRQGCAAEMVGVAIDQWSGLPQRRVIEVWRVAVVPRSEVGRIIEVDGGCRPPDPQRLRHLAEPTTRDGEYRGYPMGINVDRNSSGI
jgi:hypothetical protein